MFNLSLSLSWEHWVKLNWRGLCHCVSHMSKHHFIQNMQLFMPFYGFITVRLYVSVCNFGVKPQFISGSLSLTKCVCALTHRRQWQSDDGGSHTWPGPRSPTGSVLHRHKGYRKWLLRSGLPGSPHRQPGDGGN